LVVTRTLLNLIGRNHPDPSKSRVNLPHSDGEKWTRISKFLSKSKAEKWEDFTKLASDLCTKTRGETFRYKALCKTIDSMGEEGKEFFSKTLPFIQELILQLPVQFPDMKSIPILRQGHAATLTLTAHQCAVILACAFFNLLPGGWMCPSLDFGFILSTSKEKTKCLLHYFHRLAVGGISKRNVSFHRLVLKDPEKFKPQEGTKLTEFKVLPVGHMIEDAHGCLQADFANKWIGGGVLRGGCVQEEILFVEKPECLCSLLFCQVMLDNESITLVGAERFSKHTGYARGFKYAGDFVDKTPLDPKGRIANVIIAYDALVAFATNQYREDMMMREIVKTFVAVDLPKDAVCAGEKLTAYAPRADKESNSSAGEEAKDTSVVAPQQYAFDTFSTGNWGCGAFGGDIPLKSMLQWIGCSEAKKKVLYHTFGDHRAQGLESVVGAVMKAGKSSSWLWGSLLAYLKRKRQGSRNPDDAVPKLFDFLVEAAKE